MKPEPWFFREVVKPLLWAALIVGLVVAFGDVIFGGGTGAHLKP